MGQIDSTAVDTVLYGLSNVERFNGWNISFSGMAVVFGGLILIALTILLFNKVTELMNRKSTAAVSPSELLTADKQALSVAENIPEDHLVAISVAVELYRRLYLGVLESTVTFERGEVNSNWKTGSRYGQRKSLR